MAQKTLRRFARNDPPPSLPQGWNSPVKPGLKDASDPPVKDTLDSLSYNFVDRAQYPHRENVFHSRYD